MSPLEKKHNTLHKTAAHVITGSHFRFKRTHSTEHHDTTNHSKSNYAECVFNKKIAALDLSDRSSVNYFVCARVQECWSSGWMKLDLFMSRHNTGIYIKK